MNCQIPYSLMGDYEREVEKVQTMEELMIALSLS